MDFDAIFKQVLGQSKDLGKTLFRQFAAQAETDVRDFLERARASLEQAVTLLAAGKIDPDDFEDLVRGKQDLATMRALKQAGLAKAALDTFSNGVLNIFIEAVFAAIP
jgi:DNA-binding FadR family transcriptional regulator